MHDRLIGRRNNDDLLALVAGLLDQLLRLFKIALALQRLGADFARKRRPAREIRIAWMAVLNVAGDAEYIIVLIDRIKERLTHLLIVERRIHEIETQQSH